MNYLAKEWDKKYGRSVDHHTVRDGQYIPVNRPCDWCGELVDEGLIHEECWQKEREFWLDILY